MFSNQNPNQNNYVSSNPKKATSPGETPATLIRIVLADDHTVLRDGLAHLLNTEEDFEVVGVAEDGYEAIKIINELRPDVALMDLQMPRLSGVEAIRRLQEIHVPTNIIILTTFDSDEYIFDGIQAGAKGYLLKDVGREDLCQTIRLVSQGQTLTQPAIAARLFKLLAQDNPRKSDQTLTDRELDVLKLLARGDRNKEIANKLAISESTVKSYVTTIMQKFNVTDRTEAAIYAVQKRIIKLED